MHPLRVICFIALIAVVFGLRSRVHVEPQFQAFIKQHGRSYAVGSAEYEHRLAVFTDNLDLAESLQHQEQGTATYGVTVFSDMTPEEFRGAYLMPSIDVGDAKNSCLAHGVTAKPMAVNDLPTSIDWRDKGAVTPVKNQGGCGSCWTFSTTGSIEGQWFLAGHNLTSLSEQQLVDCSHDCSNEGDPPELVCNQGCMGGWQWNAYLTLMNSGGIMSEQAYPYQGVDGQCVFDRTKVAATIRNYTCLPTDEDQIAAFVAQNGPVAIGMNAAWLQFYLGGVSDPLFCGTKQLDHAILIVGYNDEGSRPYWIVKNSWGEHWGEKGYFKIVKGKGKCGVNEAVNSAIV